MHPLGLHTDTILGVTYSLDIVKSAKDLSDELKNVLKKNGVDYTKYNSNNNDVNKCDVNPPNEIYEYQNFFVLQRKNGDLVLLDGFRRLLWYNAPTTPILVRTYLESELSDQQILTLLVNLNHFKFFSDQNYHERGFSLLLKTVFDIDITNMKNSFDAYLSSTETKNSYSSFGKLSKQYKNEEIKKRIINKFFISDIRFLKAIKNADYLSDQYMGALVYELRSKSDKEFDANMFISLIKENNVLVELMEKYKKIGTDHSAKSQEIVNKIIEMYRNIFTIMEGGEIELSFAEKQREAKDLVEKLKKDKTLVKLTGHSKSYEIERAMNTMIVKGEKLEFVCVVHPREEGRFFNNEKIVILPHGLLEGVKYLKHTNKHLGMGTKEINIGAIIDGHECVIWHNHGSYGSYGKKYTKLRMPRGEYEVDLFVRMELEKKPKSIEPRKLKEFIYHDRNSNNLYILAWTQKEARELLESIGIQLNDSYMRDYVGKSWGTDKELLKDQFLSQPCIYSIDKDKKIERLK